MTVVVRVRSILSHFNFSLVVMHAHRHTQDACIQTHKMHAYRHIQDAHTQTYETYTNNQIHEVLWFEKLKAALLERASKRYVLWHMQKKERRKWPPTTKHHLHTLLIGFWSITALGTPHQI